jgi:lipid-A-disaccharide synthase
MASDRLRPLFESEVQKAGVADRFHLVDGNAQLVMASADVVLLASGTAALEAALLERPVVAAYRLAPLTYWLAKGLRLVKVPYFTLPNLLTPEPQVPEFLQGAATAEALCTAVVDLLDSPDRRRAIAREFARLREQLAQGADRLAANAVLGLARDRGASGMP